MNIEPARPNRVTLTGSARRPDPDATLVGAIDPQEPVAVTLRLRPKEPIPDGYTAQDRDTFERLHGARPDDIAAVDGFAKQYGLHVDRINAAERTIALSGTAAEMHDAFGVDLARYRSAEETYRGRTGDIRLRKISPTA